MAECRLIVDPPAPGPWNMAVDEALLADAAESGAATLRLYTWSEPTLSLGYFQRYVARNAHGSSRDCAVVRRQSGGGAILHDRELTYSLAIPPGNTFARHPEKTYTAVHEAFIASLEPLIDTDSAAWTLCRHDVASPLAPAEEPFLCFQRRACGDVVAIRAHGAATAAPEIRRTHQNTVKILGSAQRRHRGAILQHGSLLLQCSPSAPELSGLFDLTGKDLYIPAIIDNLVIRLAPALDVRFSRSAIPTGLESKIDALANRKYGSPVWTKRR